MKQKFIDSKKYPKNAQAAFTHVSLMIKAWCFVKRKELSIPTLPVENMSMILLKEYH